VGKGCHQDAPEPMLHDEQHGDGVLSHPAAMHSHMAVSRRQI
jgi:hypothetical protein